MTRKITPFLVLSCMCSGMTLPNSSDFTSLFNGRNLDGWWGLGTVNPESWINLPEEELAQKRKASLPDIHEHWRVENNQLINDGHGLYLTTVRHFGDFELRLEYKTVPLADSGVYLRGYPQVQIWDTTEAVSYTHLTLPTILRV